MAQLRSFLKNFVPFGVLGLCILLLSPHVSTLDLSTLKIHWQSVTAWQWLLATALTTVSFWAVSQYDVLAHRHLDTGLSERRARRSGLAAIALAQTTGFGLMVGALVRWRCAAELGPSVAAQITGFVSLLFMAALAALTAMACLAFPVPGGLVWPALAVLATLSCAIAYAAIMPRVRIGARSFRLPPLRATLQAFVWAALDVLAAAGALFVLFPHGFAPDLMAFLPVFCLALAAGLFTGTPGGVGPFEVTCLGFMQAGMPAAADVSAVIVAIMGFRLVYFAIPALLACAALIAPMRGTQTHRARHHDLLKGAPRAETAVIHQSGGRIEALGQTYSALWPTGQALVGLFDPIGPCADPAFFSALAGRAVRQNRVACLYKASAEVAVKAKREQWSVLHIADDAVIDLPGFSLHTPSRSRLRRKLRKAERQNVTVRPAQLADTVRLAAIDAHWQRDHGLARGGTMGRFCPGYLSHQRVFVAEQNAKVIAFVSFHICAQEWALDLMRHLPNLPDGTMHALVQAGISAAQARDIKAISLSAVPACPDARRAIWRWAAQKVVLRAGGTGLRQFKSAFGPRWKPLYAAAPSKLSLSIALADIAREVLYPTPMSLKDPAQSDAPYMNTDHKEDEYYEVASSRAA